MRIPATRTSSDAGRKTRIPTHSVSAANAAVRAGSSEPSARSAKNWIAAAPPSQIVTEARWTNSRKLNQVRSTTLLARLLEQLLQLHRGAHVALDLQLPGHERRHGIELAADELLEVVLADRDRRGRVRGALRDLDARGVLDVDLPRARARHVEEVVGVDALRLVGVDPLLQGV